MDNFTVDTKGASTKDLKHPGPTSNTCGRRSILMGILLRHSWMLMKKIPTFLQRDTSPMVFGIQRDGPAAEGKDVGICQRYSQEEERAYFRR